MTSDAASGGPMQAVPQAVEAAAELHTHLLCYPHPLPFQGPAPGAGDLHPTSGLAHNWALDFMAPGGTPWIAPEDAVISRWSGHDPADGVIGGDVFGWNVYLKTKAGVVYFATHLGDRRLKVGATVKLGEILGHVGHWPNDPARSHTHLGVTHPAGDQAAKAYICHVAASPRVKGFA